MFGQFMERRVMTMEVSSLGRFTQLDIVGADISKVKAVVLEVHGPLQ